MSEWVRAGPNHFLIEHQSYYAITARVEDGACQIVRDGEVIAVIPDASPLMAGDELRIEQTDAYRFFVNGVCVYEVEP